MDPGLVALKFTVFAYVFWIFHRVPIFALSSAFGKSHVLSASLMSVFSACSRSGMFFIRARRSIFS